MLNTFLGFFGLQKRSVTVVPDNLFRNAGLNTATPTGLSITPDNALNVTTVFQAIRFLSFMVASLPRITYQKNGDDRRRATRHPLYSILHDIPNPEMTSFDLWTMLASHVFGRGNGLAEIQYNERGQVTALWPLLPNNVELVRNANYDLRYRVTLPSGEKRVLRPDQVFHLRGLTKEGLWGQSVLTMHRNAVGLARATEDYGGAYFNNNAEPGVVLKHPTTLSDAAYERMSESWEQAHMGLNQSHRMAILEEGTDIVKVGFNPNDSQMLETRKFQVIEIARMFGIPPHLLFELSNATFTNIEHQSLEFVIYHLRPWLVSFEQQILRSLFLERERKAGYYTEFLVDGITRGDLSTRFNAYSVGLQNGIFSINEVRRLENMNSIEGGDTHFVPLNMTALGEDGMPVLSAPPAEEEPGEPNTPASTGASRMDIFTAPILFDAAERIIKREVNELTSAHKRYGPRTEKFTAWIEEFYKRDYPLFIQLVLDPLVRANILTEEGAQSFIESHCEKRGTIATYLHQGDAIALPTTDFIANKLAGVSNGN